VGSDERIPRLHIAACSARCLAASLVGSLPLECLHSIDILATIYEPVIILASVHLHHERLETKDFIRY